MRQTDGGAKQSTHGGGPSLTEDQQTERETSKRSVAYIYIFLQSSQQIAQTTKKN